MKIPLILQADSYKYSHYALFPEGTTNNNSYIESRGIDTSIGLPEDTEIVFFGLQAFIKEYLLNPVKIEDVNKAEKLITAHGLPFNREDWVYIVEQLDGKLPIKITALPEGTVINPHVTMVQVIATHPRFAWLASFVETSILRAVWYPTTVATLSREAKKVIKKYLEETSDDVETNLPFKLHDFGARGATSSEAAQLGGMGHLVNFMGTDTVEALVSAIEYYNADGPVGHSVPASEHGNIISWGRDGEFAAYENMTNIFAKPGAIVSCVSDSYNIYDAVDILWPKLKDKFIEANATLVVRPDSGNPLDVIPYILNSLSGSFGVETNSKGFKVLKNVRILWGDGINLITIGHILQTVKDMGFSVENLVFGMGGALLQKVNRDTLKFAMKTSAIEIDNKWIDVYKDPIGASFKKSKKGRLVTFKNSDDVIVTEKLNELNEDKNMLEPVYENGNLLVDVTFDQVRKNAEVK